MDLPEGVKSAPCSPNWQRRCNQAISPIISTSFSNWDMSQVGEPDGYRIPEPASQTLLEPVFEGMSEQLWSDRSNSAVDSCMAEQGGSSDTLSSEDREKEGEAMTSFDEIPLPGKQDDISGMILEEAFMETDLKKDEEERHYLSVEVKG
jgi:hypothetical protein